MTEPTRYSVEWRDEERGRNVARLVRAGDDVFIETEGNHDGVLVFTTVRISRVAFSERIRALGGLLP